MRGIWLAFGLTACASPSAAQGPSLEMVNNRPFVPATVNGQAVSGLLDSAAEMTILDDDFARRLGLAAGGSAAAHGSGAATLEAGFIDEVAIRVGGLDLPHMRVAVLDLADISQRLTGRPVEIILGRDVFDGGRLRVDLEGGTAAVVPANATPRGVRLAVGEHRGTPTVPASVEGHETAETVIDTGNGTGVLVGRAFAERIGLTAPGRIVGRSSGGGLGGARERDLVVLRNLRIAGREFHDVPAAIDPGETASDLNIGTSILRHFIITTDFAGHAVWLEPRE